VRSRSARPLEEACRRASDKLGDIASELDVDPPTAASHLAIDPQPEEYRVVLPSDLEIDGAVRQALVKALRYTVPARGAPRP
jgi:hypothetical protein